MNRKKTFKLLFDTSMLRNWSSKSAIRSGIFIVTYNILKEFVKQEDVKVSLYCRYETASLMKKFIKEHAWETKLGVYVYDQPRFAILRYYQLLKLRKQRAKKYRNKFAKIKAQYLLLAITPICKLINLLSLSFTKKEIASFDAYLSTFCKIPDLVERSRNILRYAILYDVIPLVLPAFSPESLLPGSWFMQLMKSLNKKDFYFSISEYTRQDVLKYCPQIDPRKIKTTLLACDENFKPATANQINEAKTKYNIPLDKKYVFSLCTLEPRKNLIRTVKTFIEFIKKNNIDDMVFVLGGGHWIQFIDQLNNEIENLGDYQDKILKIGYVDDEDLSALYSGAEWFTYTSIYEGFGLPPLEAMSCGCPVITSNNSSLPEVVGDAGVMIDCDSDEQHIEAYEKYYYNEELRKEYAQKGLERAKQFSWKKCVAEMVEVMKECH